MKNRLQQLEKQSAAPRLSNDELARRVNRVLENPNLVTPQAYSRITEIVEACKQRQAASQENKT